MSIKAEHITKIYGEQKALDDVSFNISPGEVVGFLGPNGAGKTTMMKILTGFIPPNAGKAIICDLPIEDDPIKIKNKIGYLPEQNPLYPGMYVEEYLLFIAGLFKLKKKKIRVKEMIELVGLTREKGKTISELSKGYKQRVGLAQALIHNPEVLILDEPTTGLDPNQILEIRQLISTIGKKKTVMLSTHVMQEVEAICNRVLIINQGKIVADDSSKHLLSKADRNLTVKVEFDSHVEKEQLFKIQGVEDAILTNNNIWAITTSGNIDIRKNIFDFAVNNNIAVLTIQQQDVKLEDIFKKLTKS